MNTDLNAGQKKFFHAYVRRALINWCAQGLASGDGSFTPVLPDAFPGDGDPLLEAMVDYARTKGWVSKRELKVLSKAYKTAAGMMKVV